MCYCSVRSLKMIPEAKNQYRQWKNIEQKKNQTITFTAQLLKKTLSG